MTSASEVKYAKKSCDVCFAIFAKPDMYKTYRTKNTGYSVGASINPFAKHLGRSINVGTRQHYRHAEYWLCNQCYLEYVKLKRKNLLTSLILISIFLVMGYLMFSGNSIEDNTYQTEAPTPVLDTQSQNGSPLIDSLDNLNKVEANSEAANSEAANSEAANLEAANSEAANSEAAEAQRAEENKPLDNHQDESSKIIDKSLVDSGMNGSGENHAEVNPKQDDTQSPSQPEKESVSVKPCESLKLC